MSEDKEDEKNLEALVEEQAKAEAVETGENTSDAEIDQRKSKVSTSLLIEAAGKLSG